MKNKTLLIITGSFLLIFILIIQDIIQIKASANRIEQKQKDVLAALSLFAKNVNLQLPKQLDEKTLLEKVIVGEGLSLIYQHKLINYSASKIEDSLIYDIKQSALHAKNGCKGLSYLLTNDIELNYLYLGKDNKKLGSFTINRIDCKL